MQRYLGILLTSFALQPECFQGQSEHADLTACYKPALKQAPKHTCVDRLAPLTASVGQPWASEEGAHCSGRAQASVFPLQMQLDHFHECFV